jgi:hypothetical protein
MIFWSVTPCSSEKFIATIFRVGAKQEIGRRRRKAASLFLGLLFDPEEGSDKFFRKVGLFSELHDITSRKTVLFTVTAVRTSNPTGISGVYLQPPSIFQHRNTFTSP